MPKNHKPKLRTQTYKTSFWRQLSLLILLFCLMTTKLCAQSEKKYQIEIDKIGQKISNLSRQLNNSKSQLKTEQEKILKIEQEMLSLNQNIKANDTQIKHQQSLVTQLTQQMADLQSQTEQDRQALAGLLRQRYMQGQENYFKMMLNQQNPYAVGRLQHYYDYFALAQQAKLKQLRLQAEQLQIAKNEVARQQAELSERQKEQNKRRAALSNSQQARSASVAVLTAKVAENTQTLRRLAADRDRLNSLLEQLAVQAKELKRLEQARKEQQKELGNPVPQRVPVAGGFSAQKGRLAAPVKADLKYSYGQRLRESGMLAEGVFFSTKLNQAVSSIFRGRVLFADFLKGYGLLLIVDHGDDHISLYGHNELLYKKVGDMVATNEVVARSGVTGGLRTPGLYFEIRNNATPINPADWCQF